MVLANFFAPVDVANQLFFADVAELADALDSGSSGLIHMAVEVRFLSSAPILCMIRPSPDSYPTILNPPTRGELPKKVCRKIF